MILAGIIIWLAGAGLLAWFFSSRGDGWPRWITLIALILQIAFLAGLWIGYAGRSDFTTPGRWLAELDLPWIPALGIRLHMAMDGISLLFVLLTDFLGVVAVAASWRGVRNRLGFFHFNLMWILAAIAGVFLALDLFLFYFFWELMLVPLYFIIGIWGHENRIYATLKFFIFTQASSLLMLAAILGLYFIHGRSTGVYTFDYSGLLGTPMTSVTEMLLMLGFFIAFAVKLPVIAVHTWLPDAHTEAPTAGSVILAGLVLKVGAYGMIRFLVPLFPRATASFSLIAMGLGVAGIIYAAVLAFSQTDLKRMVAYTSISHMGFVLLGIFAWNQLALEGAIVIILAHGISTGALFVLVGDIQDRTHTRELDKMGGLWSTMPRMGGAGMLFALASLGLPGLGNFVGEFLVLLGAYQVNVPLTVLASLGFIVSTIYALWLVQKTFLGENSRGWKLPDYNLRESGIMAAMIAAIVVLGIYPQPVLTTAKAAVEALRAYAPRYHAVLKGDVGSRESASPGQAGGGAQALAAQAGSRDRLPEENRSTASGGS